MGHKYFNQKKLKLNLKSVPKFSLSVLQQKSAVRFQKKKKGKDSRVMQEVK